MKAPAAAPAIRARGLGRRFGPTWAAKEIDIDVSAGEIVGLVGPDGAGKTTLLQLCAAILDPTVGACEVLGFDTVREDAQVTSRIGYMAQGFCLYDRLSVAENLRFAGQVRGVSASDFNRRCDRLLAMSGLAPFLGRREGALSGGMRKKLALCANLIHEPPLLLLDEPGLGVDPLSRRELWSMLHEFRLSGCAIVLSTSYMDEAERCDRVAFLDQGRIIALGSPRDLRARAQGRVFSVRASDPAAFERALEVVPGVLGVQWRARDIRYVTGNDAPGAAEIAALHGTGGVPQAAEPNMEDVFTVLRAEAPPDRELAPAQANLTAIAAVSERGSGGILTQDLTRRFGSFTAVDRVSLSIVRGEIFGLLGANGAGKTTLIRLLCGLVPPSSGRAEVAGADIASAPRRLRERIGYMSQRFSLYPDLTVAENFAFFASTYGLRRSEARAAIDWAIAMTGLEGLEDALVARMSGALRQRVALGCSVLHRPSILFLDEPTSGVDPLSRARFWRLIRMLAEAGMTVLVTTHNLEEAVYCHRLGLMHEGRLIATDGLEELRGKFPGRHLKSAEDVFLAFIEEERASAATARQAI